jgi:hypothetical protein
MILFMAIAHLATASLQWQRILLLSKSCIQQQDAQMMCSERATSCVFLDWSHA